MTEEKAINNLRKYINEDVIYKSKKAESDFDKYCINHCRDIETVLNLIQSQQEEIEKYKYLYDKALNDLVKAEKENKKKDKIIDEMAYEISEEDENFMALHIKEIKQYFEKKAEV